MISRVIKVENSCGQYGFKHTFTQALLVIVVEAKFNPPRLEKRSQWEFICIKQTLEELFQEFVDRLLPTASRIFGDPQKDPKVTPILLHNWLLRMLV